jgi:hypothetical protein
LKKTQREEEIKMKIKKRDELLNKKSFLPSKDLAKPTNSMTVTELKNMNQGQPVSLRNTSLKMGGTPRPCFHPNGKIAVVSGNTIKVMSTLKSNKDFSLLDLLLKHKQVTKDEGLDT